jgi:hypothetical protein
MRIDHAELKSEIQAERVQKEYDSSQASSYKNANILWLRQAPVHHT